MWRGARSYTIVGPQSGRDYLSLADSTSGSFADRIVIAPLGNVGIGTTSPAQRLDVSGSMNVSGDIITSGNTTIYSSSLTVRNQASNVGTTRIFVNSNGPNQGSPQQLIMGVDGSTFAQVAFLDTSTGGVSGNTPLVFRSMGSEIVRITNNGMVKISINYNNIYQLQFDVDLYTRYSVGFYSITSGSYIGSIVTQGSFVQYNTTSDYRLKTNIVSLSNALQRVSCLRPVQYSFKTTTYKVHDGFLAHEVAPYVPDAVDGDKDAVDSNGNIIAQSLDNSKLVPLLCVSIKELLDEVNNLKEKVRNLENKIGC